MKFLLTVLFRIALNLIKTKFNFKWDEHVLFYLKHIALSNIVQLEKSLHLKSSLLVPALTFLVTMALFPFITNNRGHKGVFSAME